MLLAKLVGTVVATRKTNNLKSTVLKVVEEISLQGKEKGKFLVVADTIGANVGDFVLTASGSSARMTEKTKERPVDGSIVAIVDTIEIDNKTVYNADGGGK